jgi:hypothetical protein
MKNKHWIGLEEEVHVKLSGTYPSDWRVEHVDDGHVHIKDLDLGNKSVTNDAEAVCEALFEEYGDRRFTYTDSMGEDATLVHDQGRFTCFRPVPPMALVPDQLAGEDQL